MAFMEWDEKYSVNIPSIDEQHKKLIDLINRFYDSIKEKDRKERLLELVSGLKDYTVYHFKTEEDLMQKYNLTDYGLHKSEHDSFIAKVDDIYQRLNSGRLVISVEVTNFIKDWLGKHILGTDKAYSKHLIEKGVQ